MSDHPAARFGGGYVPDQFDSKDHYYIPNPDLYLPSHVNLRQDHAQLVNEIYNQGQTNTCVANATSAAFWYEEHAGRREQVWGQDGPSRLFIYWLARGGVDSPTHDIANPTDTGTEPRAALKSLWNCGVCRENDWPFDPAKVNTKPLENDFKEAEPHKITRFFRLDPDRPDSQNPSLTSDQKDKLGLIVLDNLKRCLAEQFPVVFGFWYYLPDDAQPNEMWDITQTPYVLRDPWKSSRAFPRHTFPWDLPEELRFFRDENGELITPGHAVLAIGYDDEKGQILVQNSWGKEWSGNGTFWMPYSWIVDFAATNDFWTIRVTREAAELPSKGWQDFQGQI